MPPKKTATKKAPAKKSPAKKAAPKKTVARKSPKIEATKKITSVDQRITAYCVKTGKYTVIKNPVLVITEYYKMKKGVPTSETYHRYRIAGVSSDGDCKVSKPVSEDLAKQYKAKGISSKQVSGIKTIKKKTKRATTAKKTTTKRKTTKRTA